MHKYIKYSLSIESKTMENFIRNILSETYLINEFQ